MRLPTLSLATLVATTLAASGHPGHVAGLAGHDHWVAGAAIGAAIAVGLWAVLKARRKTRSGATEGERGKDAARQEG